MWFLEPFLELFLRRFFADFELFLNQVQQLESNSWL